MYLLFMLRNFNNFQSLTEDVTRQMEREKSLQQKYANLQAEIKDLQEKHQREEQERAAIVAEAPPILNNVTNNAHEEETVD